MTRTWCPHWGVCGPSSLSVLFSVQNAASALSLEENRKAGCQRAGTATQNCGEWGISVFQGPVHVYVLNWLISSC